MTAPAKIQTSRRLSFGLRTRITAALALASAGTAIFVLLGADFLGVIQLFVYVGGILVLTLFAVMLTHRIDVRVSNRAVGRLPGLVVVGVVATWMIRVARAARWTEGQPGPPAATTAGIGDAFLGTYVLPFEVASVVLLAALIGAIVVSRKEVKG